MLHVDLRGADQLSNLRAGKQQIGRAAQGRVTSLDRLAAQAAGRLPSMSLADRRDVIVLLDIQVVLTEEGYKVTGAAAS